MVTVKVHVQHFPSLLDHSKHSQKHFFIHVSAFYVNIIHTHSHATQFEKDWSSQGSNQLLIGRGSVPLPEPMRAILVYLQWQCLFFCAGEVINKTKVKQQEALQYSGCTCLRFFYSLKSQNIWNYFKCFYCLDFDFLYTRNIAICDMRSILPLEVVDAGAASQFWFGLPYVLLNSALKYICAAVSIIYSLFIVVKFLSAASIGYSSKFLVQRWVINFLKKLIKR